MDFTIVDIETWKRKAHFEFYSQFDDPFFEVTVNVDCTVAYAASRDQQVSFFLYYLFRSLQAANAIENFRYRIEGQEVRLYDCVHASPTISRPDGTFGFSTIHFHPSESDFYIGGKKAIDETMHSNDLIPTSTCANVMHMTTLPWLHFTSLKHARHSKVQDSCPKIAFGKMISQGDKMVMPVSVSGHHGLLDGYHAALFIDKFQKLLMTP